MAEAPKTQENTSQWERRVAKLWKRFCRMMTAQQLGTPEQRAAMTNPYGRINHMRHEIRQGRPAGWRWQTAMEAADVAMDGDISFPRPLPTTIRPGQGKVALMAWRYAHGFELFNEQADVNCLDDGRI
jgi:hypothetical protein